MDELLTMSAAEMARRIREGSLSPVEAVEAHIRRIEEVNPKINAVIQDRFADARKDAKDAAERLARSRDDLPPLFGVPCTIKDAMAVKGMIWVGGVWARRNKIADEDATTVARLKAAGAIILGKTNVPEASMWNETYNTVFGRTNNPYDLGRTCGGSSGGEGSAVAASCSPFGLAADIGGSIRYPSAFCGVPGHKHTGTLVPGGGHWPPAMGPLARYNSYGPIARRVEDLALVLPILAGPDGKDPVVSDHKLRSPKGVDLKKVKVFHYDYNGQVKTDADVRRAVNMAAGAMVSECEKVEHWRPAGLEYSLDIWAAGMGQNPDPLKKSLGDGEPISLYKEFFKIVTRSSKHTLPGVAAAMTEAPGKLLGFRNRKLLALAADIRRAIEERLGDNGVIVCPVFPTPAPKHTHIWRHLFGVGYSGVYNIMELPATVIPINHLENGVPVSVQVVSGRFNDHLTMAVAARLEKIFGGWKPIERVGG